MRIGILLFLVAIGVPAAGQIIAGVITKDLTCITRKGNPGVAMWKMIREALEGKDGEAFAAHIKSGWELPQLPGTVLAVEAGEYLVSVADGKTADVVLRLTGPWKGKPLAVGTELEFTAKARAFAKQPFGLTVEVDPGKMKVHEKSTRDEGEICTCYTPEELRKLRADRKGTRQ